MNWTINNDIVKSLTHNNKEIVLIVRDDDNTVIYQKNTNSGLNLGDYIELTVNGNTVAPYYHYEQLSGDGDIYIDWGDGTPLEKYNDWDVNTYRDFAHNYQSSGTYSVKVYGIKEIGDAAFDDATTITSVILPETIISIGNGAFDHTQIKSIDIPKSVTSLGSFDFITLDTIGFNWNTQNTILSYDSDWNLSNVGDPYIIIPQGTTQLYVDAGYPIAKLKESYLLLDSDKSILSYNDSEVATLTAQILTNNNINISGQKIKFEGVENTVLENHSATNSPDTNTYSLSDFWMLDATSSSSSSQIDIYRSSNAYIRIRKTSDGYRIRQSDSPIDVTLNGSVLYCDNNLFYTNEGDSLDLTSYPSVYNTIKFMVYVTINKLISYGMGVTNSNGIATCTYSSAGVGDVSFRAKSGSLVSENYIVHDYLRVFKLDGTESKYQISGTTSFSNGVMSGGCSYLQVPIDNTHDFELEFEVARTNGGCGVFIVPSGTTRRDYTELQIIHNILCWTNGSNGGSIYDGILPTTNYGTWSKVYIKKQGSTYSVSKDGENYTTLNLCNWAKTTSNWYIGLDTWSGTSSLRNIYVKPL